MYQGGSFLLGQTALDTIFIPEEFSEEQKGIRNLVRDFCLQEVQPIIRNVEVTKDAKPAIEMLEKSAGYGLCGVSIEERFGGIDLNFTSGLIVSENIAIGLSFGTTLGAQTSIGSLPIVFYGTEAQKQKYLPGIAAATIKTCYCLTEPDSGSDANSGKTKAVLSADGKHYLINGQKMWITNGGFADLMIVFAKIEGDENLSAFIVEYAFGGITRGPEEKKLGLKGSSTVQLFFNDCKVPIENLLGNRGEGFKMALNILNTGRIKLAAGSVGGSKYAIDQAVEYALNRVQFKKPIIDFGAIQHKIGEMASRTFCNESALYRCADNIDDKINELKNQGATDAEAKIKAVREYAIECAILKVHCSETVDFCIDETVQIFGGMGYSAESSIETGYRDSRILRIYEGTNEINRMLVYAELMKRAFKSKELDLGKAFKSLPLRYLNTFKPIASKGFCNEEAAVVQQLKNVFLFLAAVTGSKLKEKMIEEQEMVMHLSDILSEIYITESTLLRLQKLKSIGAETNDKEKLFKIYLYEAFHRVRKSSYDVLNACSVGLERRWLISLSKRFSGSYYVDAKMLRREIAEVLKEKKSWCFS